MGPGVKALLNTAVLGDRLEVFSGLWIWTGYLPHMSQYLKSSGKRPSINIAQFANTLLFALFFKALPASPVNHVHKGPFTAVFSDSSV